MSTNARTPEAALVPCSGQSALRGEFSVRLGETVIATHGIVKYCANELNKIRSRTARNQTGLTQDWILVTTLTGARGLYQGKAGVRVERTGTRRRRGGWQMHHERLRCLRADRFPTALRHSEYTYILKKSLTCAAFVPVPFFILRRYTKQRAKWLKIFV
jgi:hypothetical protein